MRADADRGSGAAIGRNGAAAYVVAALLTIAAALLRVVMDRYLSGVQFITFFPAVILSAVYLGTGPALFSVGLSGLLGWYLLIPIRWSFVFEDFTQGYTLALYLMVAAATAVLIGNAREATRKLRAAEAALRLSEDRYRRIFEQANDIVFTADLDQLVTDCNPAGAEALGMTREEIVGRNISEFVSDEGYRQTTRMLRQKLEHGGTTRHDIEVRTRSGKRLFWEINSGLATEADGRIVGLHAIARDVTERRRLEERQRLLVNELNHRVKNTLSLVQGLALQSFRDGSAMAEARTAFQQRLAALARAHDLLTRESWEGATLPDLVHEATGHYNGAERRIRGDGPDLKVPAKAAVSLAMALHELATNAVKYGALSVPGGWIELNWRDGDDGRLSFEWIEHDGPPAVAPERRGFGLRMIERAVASDFGGRAEMRFTPEGFRCVIDEVRPEARREQP